MLKNQTKKNPISDEKSLLEFTKASRAIITNHVAHNGGGGMAVGTGLGLIMEFIYIFSQNHPDMSYRLPLYFGAIGAVLGIGHGLEAGAAKREEILQRVIDGYLDSKKSATPPETYPDPQP